jgi:catechol 2,3-dioxygenase-like lactoylglutathione lyase family enzyme
MKTNQPFDRFISRRQLMAGVAGVGIATLQPISSWSAPLPASALDHVNIRVPDVDRSAEFYTKPFGIEISRSPSAKAQTANPDSPSGVLWFVQLGESSLAISPTGPRLQTAIDHICFSITGFNGQAMKRDVAVLNQQWPDSPPNNLWVRDPAGHVIQLSASPDPSRPRGAGVGAIRVPPPGGVPRRPAFTATRFSRLTLAVPDVDAAANYYRELLGSGAETQRGHFRVGQSDLMLDPAAGGESFRVAVEGFNAVAAVRALAGFGITAQAAPDASYVSFRDPDGLNVQIGG